MRLVPRGGAVCCKHAVHRERRLGPAHQDGRLVAQADGFDVQRLGQDQRHVE